MIKYDHNHCYSPRLYIHCYDPMCVHTQKQLQMYDGFAAHNIAELESVVENLKEYRRQVFLRMQQLYASPYTTKIVLRRERSFRSNLIFYFLEEWKVYEDASISPEILSAKRYSGKERRQAMKDFEAYKKEHPGIYSELFIEKGKCE